MDKADAQQAYNRLYEVFERLGNEPSKWSKKISLWADFNRLTEMRRELDRLQEIIDPGGDSE